MFDSSRLQNNEISENISCGNIDKDQAGWVGWWVCGVAILFLFDVDTVARRRMYGANQVIENQWGGDEDNDNDAGDDYNDDDFKCSIFSGLL